MDTRLPLRRLEIFCLVVDEGGVTRAAERLLVAQPGVSAQLRSLERSLGSALFTRSGSSIVLTEAGERVYRWAKEVLAGSVQVQRDIDELTAGTAGSLTVASSMAVGTYLLPPLMTRLRAERAGADITVHISEPSAAVQAVELGEVDFAVTTWLDEPTPDALVAEKLWEEPIILCANPNGPPDGDAIDLSELPGLPLVGAPAGVAFHRMVTAQLRDQGAGELQIVIRLGHAEAIKQAVAANGWVCLVSAYCVADDIAAGRLRAVRIRDADLVEGIGLHHRAVRYFSPLQRAAIEQLRSTAAAKAATVRTSA
jgi:DNA-binding transcriptional LysR family regulator